LSYDVHTLTAIDNCACAVSRVTYFQGFDINHIFETPDPYLSIHFATFMALRHRLTNVIHKK